ncbi:MAG: oxidoreductase [Pyrinomonadaceae bacterium]|nr:oxidoreductase [Pyrinomonadaceae bacterium]
MKIAALLLFSILSAGAASAGWVPQASGVTVRFRGVSAVSRSVAWASGDKGTYARTVDGGMTWRAGAVPGATELDFRDVDAFDADTAYLLSIGEGEKSRIYKTTDGGKSWTLQFKSNRPQAFFDSMAFWDRDHGIAVSDPVEGRFLIITTSDGGRTWKEMPADGMPQALQGEGAFAASGTCITVEGKRNVWFGTGGPEGARVFRSTDGGRTWTVAKTPVISGKAAGIFSVAFWNAKQGVVVGGDYTKEREARNNVAVTSDGGRTWSLIDGRAPDGYRSCVVFVPAAKKPTLVTVGPSGSDYSLDEGRSWTSIGTEGFHSTSFKSLSAGWAVGEAGRIAMYQGKN